MNVLKNFEALFVVTLGLACAVNYVADGRSIASTDVAAAAPAAQNMQVVVVSAKRLSPEQKLQSLAEERAALIASRNADKKI